MCDEAWRTILHSSKMITLKTWLPCEPGEHDVGIHLFCCSSCHHATPTCSTAMECPACREFLGSKFWADQQRAAKDPFVNDWLWTCRSCAKSKACHYDYSMYHLKRYVKYLNAAFSFGLFAQIWTYRSVHQNSHHESNHRQNGLNCGHKSRSVTSYDFAMVACLPDLLCTLQFGTLNVVLGTMWCWARRWPPSSFRPTMEEDGFTRAS